MKYCPNCGRELKDEMKFCGGCGTPQMIEELKDTKKRKKKKWTWILLVFIILTLIASGIVFLYFWKIKPEEKNYDENNIGAVYFHQIEEEHIASDKNGIKYTDNEILLVAEEGTSYKKIERIAKSVDAEIVGWIEQTGDYQLKFEGKYSLEELELIAEKLEAKSKINSAYVNYVFMTGENKTESRNGFIYGDKWEGDLQNFNNCKGKSWGLEAIEALAAWDVLEQHSDEVFPVRVGLIDNGFDTDHEDLGFAETFYNVEGDHGTHVAGTMAANANNEEGICGVYPYGDGNLYGVSLDGVRTHSENEHSLMYLKIAYAELILRNVKIINSSWGYKYKEAGISNTSEKWDTQVAFMENYSYILGDFLNRLLEKGYDFVLVNSAGNDSERVKNVIFDSKYNFWTTVIDREDYPEVYDRIIVVGSVDQNFNISNFSNDGDRVDIYAPGEVIYSTLPGNKYASETLTKTWSGTSMAAPHVSGVAAMVWSVNNDLTGSQVKEIVCRRGSFKCNSCKMVDAYIAMEAAVRTNTETTQTQPENGSILCWVLDSGDEFVKIENALVTATNVSTGETVTTTTDVFGHFELILQEGEYTLTVQAEGYEEYVWPNGNENYTNPIVVRNGSVNYLDDWIKMKNINIFGKLPQEFVFTSGVGGWETYITLNGDGKFTGQYHDSDLGDMGERYANGTVYICDFSGEFVNPIKINEYIYSVKLKSLETEGDFGSIYYENNTRYIVSKPYGFENADEFLIYLPGCPLDDTTEEFIGWSFINSQVLTKIPVGIYGLYNVSGTEAFIGKDDNTPWNKSYIYTYNSRKSELQPSYYSKSHLVFWSESGAAVLNIMFDWSEDTQREFIADDSWGGTGKYRIELEFSEDYNSVKITVESMSGFNLTPWGGTADGTFSAEYLVE